MLLFSENYGVILHSVNCERTIRPVYPFSSTYHISLNLKEFIIIMKRKLIVGFLALCSITTVCPSVYASTEHYTDSSVTGADSGWSDWDANWADTAADFTKVSLTPGADDTQLNFAWYSEKGDSDATPVVHFGTDNE